MRSQTKVYLTLQNGMVFEGSSHTIERLPVEGETVFTTGMTGYDLSLTDPSYTGQILVFTYPLIGNYGVPPKELWESDRVHPTAVVISSLCEEWSHGQSTQSLLSWLADQNIPLLTGIDTRALTKVLREAGTMLGSISYDKSMPKGNKENLPLGARVCTSQKITHATPCISNKKTKKVILVDCGMKTNILRNLLHYPLTVDQVPHHYDYSNEDYDGVFLSNGPGDPSDYVETVANLRKAMKKDKPIFGICLGAQLMGLAAGAKTFKLRYGHRGHNQPCIEVETKRCFITSQNHGYAIAEETLPTDWKVSFRNLNDNTIEGIKHSTLPFSAVQFHPEAAPGPTDTEWLFEHFVASL